VHRVDGDNGDLQLGSEIGLHQEQEWNASGWGWGPWGMESTWSTANSSTITQGKKFEEKAKGGD